MKSLRPVKRFHVRAAATGNARSPTVDSRVDVQCRRRRLPQALSTGNPGDRLKGVGQIGLTTSRKQPLAYPEESVGYFTPGQVPPRDIFPLVNFNAITTTILAI